MTAPQLATVDSSILNEINSKLVKTTNELKINRWKRTAKKLERVSLFTLKRTESIIASYENKPKTAINLMESALHFAQDNGEKADAYFQIGEIYFSIGEYSDSITYYLEAFNLVKDLRLYRKAITVSKMFYLNDVRVQDAKYFSEDQKEDFIRILQQDNESIACLVQENLSLEIFREVLAQAIKVFCEICFGGVNRVVHIGNNHLSLFICNQDLDTETVLRLNERMLDELMELSKKYDYEELLKYPVVFTSEEIN